MPFLSTMTQAILPGGLTIGQPLGTQSLEIYATWGLQPINYGPREVYAENCGRRNLAPLGYQYGLGILMDNHLCAKTY